MHRYQANSISVFFTRRMNFRVNRIPCVVICQVIESEVFDLPARYAIGPLSVETHALKEGLISECRSWRTAIGHSLNVHCSAEMAKSLLFMEDLLKRLNRPIKDLDDVRAQMAALEEFRTNEISLQVFSIGPITEAYALLARYDIQFRDGNAELVDSLSYTLQKLKAQALSTSNHLLKIQPTFKAELDQGVAAFIGEHNQFVADYKARYCHQLSLRDDRF